MDNNITSTNNCVSRRQREIKDKESQLALVSQPVRLLHLHHYAGIVAKVIDQLDSSRTRELLFALGVGDSPKLGELRA